MTEYTDDDVTRLADLLGGGLPAFPEETRQRIANHLLEQGVTLPPPPPDPAVVVAEVLVRNAWPSSSWHGDSDPNSGQARFITGLQDLFTPEALADAAARVQEADHEVDRLRAENDRLRAVVLAGQEARAVEQDEPFDHEHAEAAWAAYDVAVERLEADRG